MLPSTAGAMCLYIVRHNGLEPLATQQLKKSVTPCTFTIDEQLFDLQLYWVILMTSYVDRRTGQHAKASIFFFSTINQNR